MTDPAEACDFSVVVPIFRGASLVEQTVARLAAGVGAAVPDHEIVLVDDGSADGTAEAVRRVAGSSPRVRAVVLDTNQGKGGAVAAGMAAARGRVRAFTDVDVPFGTEPLVAMYGTIRSGRADVAVGDRRLPGSRYFESVPVVRRLASHAFTGLVRMLAPCDALDTQCGIKAFDAGVAGRLFPLLRERGFAFDAELLYLCRKYGLRVARQEVSLVHAGPSSVSITRVALPMLSSVSKLRMRWSLGRYHDAWLAARGEARRRERAG